jgi:2,3-bisphosphoglycerate-independent phosphoglycerate mutase
MKSFAFNNRHVILFFVDGLGVGELNPDFNPCCYTDKNIFNTVDQTLPFGGKKYALDACLGVDGLPQSGSGQTTIYTGENAPRLIGQHLFGFPNRELLKLIRKKSLFITLLKLKYRCKFINAFRPVFFTTPELFRNIRMSATTEMNRAAQLPFCKLNDISKGNALYHDYTNEILRTMGFKLPKYSATHAAEILLNENKKFDLILYEFFLTDMAGHSKNMKMAVKILQNVENLLYSLVEKIDVNQTAVLLVSDHGNVEDLRTKSHTKNPAIMGLWGKTEDHNKCDLSSLMDIMPLIIHILEN